MIKEFGNNNGIIYVDKLENALDKAADLIKNRNIGEDGKRLEHLLKKKIGIISLKSVKTF